MTGRQVGPRLGRMEQNEEPWVVLYHHPNESGHPKPGEQVRA